MNKHAAGSVQGDLSFPIGTYTDVESLRTTGPFAGRTLTPLLIQARKGISDQIEELRDRGIDAPLIADTAAWRSRKVQTDPTLALGSWADLFTSRLDEWADSLIKSCRASAVLTPSLFVPAADWVMLNSLVAELTDVSDTRLIPFIPTSAAMLDTTSFPEFRAIVDRLRNHKVAFLFADKAEGLARSTRITSIRTLLGDHSDAWLCGVDPLIATDALVHGASAVFVGARSSLRWPSPPGESKGGPQAVDFIPGLFNRHLLSIRSPSVYADWYANSASPICDICSRAVDRYTSLDEDKTAVIEHNLHAVRSFGLELLGEPESERARWLHEQRVDAFTAHRVLDQGGAELKADATLRCLCELDDPYLRKTTPKGAWR